MSPKGETISVQVAMSAIDFEQAAPSLNVTDPLAMSRISPKQAHRRFIAMNTITVHANNRVASSLLPKRTSTILSPVAERYGKPRPWWIHEFGLTSIEETNQEAEEVMDVRGIEEQDGEVGEKQAEKSSRLDEDDEPTEDFGLAGEVEIFVDAKFLPKGLGAPHI